MKTIIIILSIVTGCLLALTIYVNISETNYSDNTKSSILVVACSLTLLVSILEHFQKKKENDSSK
jgi:ABC-type sulfate transport system permease component